MGPAVELTVQRLLIPSRQTAELAAVRFGRWPWATLFLAAAALLAHLQPTTTLAWQWQRDLLATQPWRLLTGHLTHWGAEHLFWDLLILLVAGAALERISRRRWLFTMVLAAPLISVGLWLWQPQLAVYRGLSGIDSALVAAWCASWVVEGRRRGSVQQVALGLIGLAGLFAKLLFETASGDALFVATAAAGFVAVPFAHVLGGLCGLGGNVLR